MQCLTGCFSLIFIVFLIIGFIVDIGKPRLLPKIIKDCNRKTVIIFYTFSIAVFMCVFGSSVEKIVKNDKKTENSVFTKQVKIKKKEVKSKLKPTPKPTQAIEENETVAVVTPSPTVEVKKTETPKPKASPKPKPSQSSVVKESKVAVYTKTPNEIIKPTPSPTSYPKYTPPSDISVEQVSYPTTITGQGQQATSKVKLNKGLAVFELNSKEGSYFSVWLMDSNGEKIDLLANATGSFTGTKAVQIETTGEYLFNVSGEGKWSIKISQPKPTQGTSKPTSFSGNGQQMTPYLKLKRGLTIFKITCNGGSYFSAWLVDSNGEKIDLLANETGVFNVSKAVQIEEDGFYFIQIQSEGGWSIKVE